MTAWEVIRAVSEPLTAAGAIVAAIKAWLADRKIGEIRNLLVQQQQRQSQQITNVINVGAPSATTGSAKTGKPVTFSEGEE